MEEVEGGEERWGIGVKDEGVMEGEGEWMMEGGMWWGVWGLWRVGWGELGMMG